MRRLALAVLTLGTLVALATPAWGAPNAGQFCKNAESGLTTTANNGRQVTCTLESGRYHWAYTTGTPTPTTAATSGTVTANPTVAAAATSRSGLASTGLNHIQQLVELALVLIGLGTALVLEGRARDGLDRLRRQR